MLASEQFVLVFLGSLIFCILISRWWAHKNVVSKQRYDERQQLVLGQAYGVGFRAMCLVGLCYTLTDFFFPALPIQPSLAVFTMMMIGITAMSCYRILKDAFFMIGQRGRLYVIILVIITIQQAWMVYTAIMADNLVENGVYAFSGWASLVILLSFVLVLSCLAIKRLRDRDQGDD